MVQVGTYFSVMLFVQVVMCLLQIVQVGDKHGIRFPREFGLLLKQLLYFDRYTQLLAPTLSVLQDDRVKIRQSPTVSAPDGTIDTTIA